MECDGNLFSDCTCGNECEQLVSNMAVAFVPWRGWRLPFLPDYLDWDGRSMPLEDYLIQPDLDNFGAYWSEGNWGVILSKTFVHYGLRVKIVGSSPDDGDVIPNILNSVWVYMKWDSTIDGETMTITEYQNAVINSIAQASLDHSGNADWAPSTQPEDLLIRRGDMAIPSGGASPFTKLKYDVGEFLDSAIVTVAFDLTGVNPPNIDPTTHSLPFSRAVTYSQKWPVPMRPLPGPFWKNAYLPNRSKKFSVSASVIRTSTTLEGDTFGLADFPDIAASYQSGNYEMDERGVIKTSNYTILNPRHLLMPDIGSTAGAVPNLIGMLWPGDPAQEWGWGDEFNGTKWTLDSEIITPGSVGVDGFMTRVYHLDIEQDTRPPRHFIAHYELTMTVSWVFDQTSQALELEVISSDRARKKRQELDDKTPSLGALTSITCDGNVSQCIMYPPQAIVEELVEPAYAVSTVEDPPGTFTVTYSEPVWYEVSPIYGFMQEVMNKPDDMSYMPSLRMGQFIQLVVCYGKSACTQVYDRRVGVWRALYNATNMFYPSGEGLLPQYVAPASDVTMETPVVNKVFLTDSIHPTGGDNIGQSKTLWGYEWVHRRDVRGVYCDFLKARSFSLWQNLPVYRLSNGEGPTVSYNLYKVDMGTGMAEATWTNFSGYGPIAFYGWDVQYFVPFTLARQFPANTDTTKSGLTRKWVSGYQANGNSDDPSFAVALYEGYWFDDPRQVGQQSPWQWNSLTWGATFAGG